MGQPQEQAQETIDQKRRVYQMLLARGQISLDDYEAIGRLSGFVSPAKRSIGASVRIGASVTGYVLLALGAVAEIAATKNPELRGPLKMLAELAQLFAGAF
jgi:hypothetical protein